MFSILTTQSKYSIQAIQLPQNVLFKVSQRGLRKRSTRQGNFQKYSNVYDGEDDSDDDEVDEDDEFSFDMSEVFDVKSSKSPSETVAELDKYIVGQSKAKRSVAIALKKRWWNQELRRKGESDNIRPSNILMIGPTGCGKTEIARHLADLSQAPFVKVDATVFTEVGFKGKDVDSIISDLYKNSIKCVERQLKSQIHQKAVERAETYLAKTLFRSFSRDMRLDEDEDEQLVRENLKAGEYESEYVRVNIEPARGPDENIMSALSFFAKRQGHHRGFQRLQVSKARQKLVEKYNDEINEQIGANNQEFVTKITEEKGIVFIDEIDKICSLDGQHAVSDEGVQKDLLPLIEGTTIKTRWGPIKTDQILFICAGAFHSARVTDLLPELQGRLPITVELEHITASDMFEILMLEKNNIFRHYQRMLIVENVLVDVKDEECVKYIANFAFQMNKESENIGARRINTIIERIFEELSFSVPEISKALSNLSETELTQADTRLKTINKVLGDEAAHLMIDTTDVNELRLLLTREYLEARLESLMKNENLEQHIL